MVRKKKNLVNDYREPTRLAPKKLMARFFNEVSVKTAAIVIFFAVLVESIIFSIYGVPSIIKYFFLRLIEDFVFNWFILAVILFVLVYLIKGKNKITTDLFKKILSGLASFKILHIIFTLVSFLVVVIFSPSLINFVKSIIANPLNAYSSTAFVSLGFGNILALTLLAIIGIIMVIYFILLTYQLVKNMFEYKGVEVNVLLTIVIFVVIYLIGLII